LEVGVLKTHDVTAHIYPSADLNPVQCNHITSGSKIWYSNPQKPNPSKYYTLPYRPNITLCHIGLTYHFKFLTFGHSGAQSARVPECQKW